MRPTLIPEEAAAAVVPPTGRRSLRRPRAETMSQAMFPSISRTPLPPGGVYEGEKKERGNTEEGDFNRNVGKVVDTLKRDYPRMFTEPLDFDIYTPDLQLRDPVSVAALPLITGGIWPAAGCGGRTKLLTALYI